MQENHQENKNSTASINHSKETGLKYPKWAWICFTLSGLFFVANFISMCSAARELEKITGEATWEIIFSSLFSFFTGNPFALIASAINILLNPRYYELMEQCETARHYAFIGFWASLVFAVLWIWRHNVYKNKKTGI